MKEKPFQSVTDFRARKSRGEKISMVTCYDSTFASLLANSPVDTVLVGDSLAMTIYGAENTLAATIEDMERHVQAVTRNLPNKFIVGDLPFLSYRGSLDRSIESVRRLMTSGAQAVKLEGGEENRELIELLSKSGIPVIGHLGLTPQHVHQLGGFRVQGRDSASQDAIFESALRLQDAGIVALVLECVPREFGRRLSAALEIPVIGIGAGPDVDGQVLVLHDLLGLNSALKPKFVKTYLPGAQLVLDALAAFDQEVRTGVFPSSEQTYEL